MLSSYQQAYSLKVAIAASKEKHLLDDVILISGHINEL